VTDTEFTGPWVDAYFNHGIDVHNRRVFLDTTIEEQSIGAAVKGLYLMETQSKEDPVEIFISSYGGDLCEALALYDIVNTLKCPVHTFGYGKVMSAAPLLLAAGDKGNRWVSPHVALMHHDISTSEEGTRLFIKGAMHQTDNMYKQWITLLTLHSKKTYKWWDGKVRSSSDFYYSAEDAIEWGVADHTWIEK